MIDPHAKVMGLPLYLWAVGLAGAIGVGIYLRRKNAAKNSGDGSGSNDAADATDPTNQDDFGDVGSGLPNGGTGGFNEAPPPAGTTNNDDVHLDKEILALLRKERAEELKRRREAEKRKKKHQHEHKKHHPQQHHGAGSKH